MKLKSKEVGVTSKELISIFIQNDLENSLGWNEYIRLMKKTEFLKLEMWRDDDLKMWHISVNNFYVEGVFTTYAFIFDLLGVKKKGIERDLFQLLKELYF